MISVDIQKDDNEWVHFSIDENDLNKVSNFRFRATLDSKKKIAEAVISVLNVWINESKKLKE